MKRFLFVYLTLILTVSASAQQRGCTDTTAINFNPEAVVNDGSCIYAPVAYKPPILVRKLPKTVNETSGLIYWRDSFWTLNDSDNKNELYRLNPINGKVIQTIIISNASNYDWEEVTQDDDYIYIGDFGNNYGNRENLRVFKIHKSDIPDSVDVSVIADTIAFRYGNQDDFTTKNLSNDFDCEAMIALGDSLYLFSKNWVSGTTRVYALPKNRGNYVISPIDEFDVNGLITGAAFDHDNSRIVLIGYRNYFPFVWILSDFQKNRFFSGNKKRIDFKELFGTQTEAITYTSDDIFVISCEKTPLQNARLFKMEGKIQDIRKRARDRNKTDSN